MKVFICWSGKLSLRLGECLRNWIPSVIQSVEPYFTPADVDKGTRWLSEITDELNKSKIGLLCITPESIHSDWILFEAGALSKQLDKAHVCPILFGVKTTDLAGPLKQFQVTDFEKDDFRKLVNVINDCLGEKKLAPKTLDNVFAKWWPDLEDNVRQILNEIPETDEPIRSDRELLEEILVTTRTLRSTSSRSTNSRPISPNMIAEIFEKFIALRNQQAHSHGGYQDALDLMSEMRDPIRRLARYSRPTDEVRKQYKRVVGLEFQVERSEDEDTHVDEGEDGEESDDLPF